MIYLSLVFLVLGNSADGLEDENAYLTTEQELSRDILAHYNKNIRPIAKSGDITHVFLELSLMNILELDTKNQILRTNTEFILKWMDHYLQWDPAKYNNVTLLRMPFHRVWAPDIVLYNTAEPNYAAGLLNTNVIVKYTGLVELVSHANFVSICNVDIQWYPFDEQTCHLSFASWTYDEGQIALILGPADISEYEENAEFLLENFYADQESMFNPCCAAPMSAANFYIQLQRRTKFSVFSFIMPGILINICALVVFSLPAESGEKQTLGISAMLAMIVFLMEMANRIPPTEALPLAGVYYGVCLSLITANIGFGILIMNLNLAGERKRRIPQFLRITILFLVKIFSMEIPESIQQNWCIELTEEEEELNDMVFERRDLKNRVTKVSPLDFNVMLHAGIREERKIESHNYIYKDAYERRTIEALETITGSLEEKEKEDEKIQKSAEIVQEWKFISRVLDRVLFYLFSVLILLVNLFILTSSPFGENFSYCPVEESKCKGLSREKIMEMSHKGAGHKTGNVH